MRSKAKVHNPGVQGSDGEFQLWFHCPEDCHHALAGQTVEIPGWEVVA